MFRLTDTKQIACHGDFKTFEDAKMHAESIQEFGLCETYSIGTYVNGSFEEVYSSKDHASPAFYHWEAVIRLLDSSSWEVAAMISATIESAGLIKNHTMPIPMLQRNLGERSVRLLIHDLTRMHLYEGGLQRPRRMCAEVDIRHAETGRAVTVLMHDLRRWGFQCVNITPETCSEPWDMRIPELHMGNRDKHPFVFLIFDEAEIAGPHGCDYP